MNRQKILPCCNLRMQAVNIYILNFQRRFFSILQSAVIGYLLESDAATCIFSPDEYLNKYEKPYDFVLASGR